MSYKSKFTGAQIDERLEMVENKADTTHSHKIEYITDLQTELDSKAPATHSHAISDITDLQAQLDGKQAQLVSGGNIKSINGQSLLGAGDLEISGSSGGLGLEVGDTVITARALDAPAFLRCDNGEHLIESYPALANLMPKVILSQALDWSSVTSGSGTTSIRAVATGENGTWVAVGNSGTMRRSTDNGVTWSSVTSGFGTNTIRAVATDKNGAWVAGGDSGIMTHSTDNGVTWSSVTSGFGTNTIRAVATDKNGTWVAGGDSGIMRRSTDNGATTFIVPPIGIQSPTYKAYIFTGVS